MNYELGLKLKKKGFPSLELIDGVLNHLPTLSELIVACGLGFAMQSSGDKWFAQRFGEGKERIDALGSTPEEAVARLWLALH